MRNRSENQITLVMIRHGETKANREHRYLGRTEEELSEEGKKGLYQNREQARYPRIDSLFSSPMKRCVQTAEILYPSLQPLQIAEWREMDFGRFEGKNYEELRFDQDYQAWIDSNGTLPFPNGESRADFILRCEQGFWKMLERIRQMEERIKPKTVGMVVHGGTIMALLSRYCGGDYFDYQVANGEGYLCKFESPNGRTDRIEMIELRKI